MDIVRMRCGLGNQMFCYALYLELIHRGRDAKIDLGFYTKYPDWPDPYVLEDVFPNIKIDPLDENYFNVICDKYNNDRKDKKKIDYYETHLSERYFWGENVTQVGCFNPRVFETRNCAYVGTWISEKYFENVTKEVRKSFKFNMEKADLRDFICKIKNSDSVSLNIRLGRNYSYVDTKTPNGTQIVNIAKEGYYGKAIDKMNDIVGSGATWYVFSDSVDVLTGKISVIDIIKRFRPENVTIDERTQNYIEAVEKIKDELKDLNVVYVNKDMFDQYEDWYDMCLMSQCSNNIISNSTFGWWGAWLNDNRDKVVIAPKVFFLPSECTDICPDEWIRL